MHRLVYTSRVVREDIIGSGNELADIVADSELRNREQQITGALMLVGNRFVQVLEGKFAFLEDTFERICCDFRHSDLRLIDMQPIEERAFGDWSMACLSASEQCSAGFAEALTQIHDLVAANPREAVQQMRALLEGTKPLSEAA